MALFIPELASKMLINEIGKRLVISNLATDISKSIDNIQWQGKTINFPVFTRTAVATDIEENGSVTPSMLSGDNTTATINHVAASVKWHKDQLKYAGNQLADLALNDLAGAMALKVDSDIMTTAINGAVLKKATASATEITAAELLDGFSLFGDKQNTSEFAAIVINSKLLTSLYAMDEFTSTEKTFNAANNGIISNQLVGYFRGVPVMVTDNGNFLGTQPECKSLIIKNGALGRALKQDVEFNEQYNNTTFYTACTADTYGAYKVMNTSGIILLCKTTA